jgi:hypothetical protein
LVLGLGLAVVLAAVGLEAMLYVNLQSQSFETTVLGPDGTTAIGFGVPVTSEYVLTNVDPPAGARLAIGSESLPLSLIRTERIEGVYVSLLHLETPASRAVVALRALQNGEFAVAKSPSGGKWEGTLTENDAMAVESQPGVVMGDLASILAKSDGALLGISVPGSKGDVVLGARALLARFPELK